MNQAFADAVVDAAADGEVVLVQDYQLALVPGMLRAPPRPDLRIVHFTHTPFCGPTTSACCPTDVADALLRVAGARPGGFHTARWAAIRASVREVLGDDAHGRRRSWRRSAPTPTRSPTVAASTRGTEAGARARRRWSATAARVPHRPDRASKNIVRGFLAFDRLLDAPSRVAASGSCSSRCSPVARGARRVPGVPPGDRAGRRTRERALGDRDWQPVVLDTRDDFPLRRRLQRYDVLAREPDARTASTSSPRKARC